MAGTDPVSSRFVCQWKARSASAPTPVTATAKKGHDVERRRCRRLPCCKGAIAAAATAPGLRRMPSQPRTNRKAKLLPLNL